MDLKDLKDLSARVARAEYIVDEREVADAILRRARGNGSSFRQAFRARGAWRGVGEAAAR